MSLAVPTAMAAAQGAVTKLGLLVVRGHVLEGLVKSTDLVLDKTGTAPYVKINFQGLPVKGSSEE